MQQGKAFLSQTAMVACAGKQGQCRVAAASIEKIPGSQKVEALPVVAEERSQKVLVTRTKDLAGKVFFCGKPARQMGVVPLDRQIACEKPQPVGQNVHDARKFARGAFRGLPAKAAQGVVHVCRNPGPARNLNKPVGVVLALKGVFLQFGAFVKGVADAPVNEGFKRLLGLRATRQHAVRMATQRGDLRHLCGIAVFIGGFFRQRQLQRRHAAGGHGLYAGAVTEKVMGRVFESPENPLAHGLAQKVAQGCVRNGSVHVKAAALVGQQAVNGAIVAHQVAHEKIAVGQQPASVHASSSWSRARATAMSYSSRGSDSALRSC